MMPQNGKSVDFQWWDHNFKGDLQELSFDLSKNISKAKKTKLQLGKNETGKFAGHKAGLSGDLTLLKAEAQITENTTLGINGPSAGGFLGATIGSETSLGLMVEPSLVKVEAQYTFTENVAVYGSLGLNADTGLKIDSKEGFKACYIGFGLTGGIGGRWSIDTPFGSLGGCSPMTQKHTYVGEMTISKKKK